VLTLTARSLSLRVSGSENNDALAFADSPTPSSFHTPLLCAKSWDIVAHRFLQEYNAFDQYATISHDFAHSNGVWNEEGVGLSANAKASLFSEPETRKDKLLAVKVNTYRTADFPRYEK
jgi:hypothetical protein